ncbi:MAG: translation factor GTPase family protein [Eubacterium sp.]|nr:translation factor GTPase family protein [Eubacterium sp.]
MSNVMLHDAEKKKHPVIGILAHVDAGKTTLSEQFALLSGKIRKAGRVDHGDAYLDTDSMEKSRGITIFSKQAELSFEKIDISLLDTPGHADFSPEMERVLQVLDAAVLVISAADGVEGQVKILWKLLKHYHVPVFIFINKLDQAGTDYQAVCTLLREKLDSSCIDFTGEIPGEKAEDLAVTDEVLMEKYLETGVLTDEEIQGLIRDRKVFPIYGGSALKGDGVDALISGITRFSEEKVYGERFGARVFKISRDQNGARLTWMKITGGSLRVKDLLEGGPDRKVDQIRIYSGSGFAAVQEADAGQIVAVTGLADTYAGECIGAADSAEASVLQPVYTCRVIPGVDEDAAGLLDDLNVLAEEEPMLHIEADPETKEISAQIMGPVQMEILKQIMKERFHRRIDFGETGIVYKETIASPVEGVGHFEPLRHYAEVHLLLEPAERGSGLSFAADCSTDLLNRNWQRLILTHLEEKKYRGVLTGSEITDMKITLIAGKAHEKHTEGGDFREATYRAVRQGLMMAENVLLEPVLEFRAEVPVESIGRLLNDIQRMGGRSEAPESDTETAVVSGTVPASKLGSYPVEVASYMHGRGHLFCTFGGYEPCPDAEQVIEEIGYDPEADILDPASSVFCSHGAGTVVPWNMVRDYMHVDTGKILRERFREESEEDSGAADTIGISRREKARNQGRQLSDYEAEDNELKEIFERTFGTSWRPDPSKRAAGPYDHGSAEIDTRIEPTDEQKASNAKWLKEKKAPVPQKEKYLLVDGYNIIFAWDELRALAAVNMDAARDKLTEICVNFHGTRQGTLILVFDAYKVPGGVRSITEWQNIFVVYTKEAETADAYIEKTVHRIASKADVSVATSDGLEQMIIFGSGAKRMSAREFQAEVNSSMAVLRENYLR